MKKKTHPKYYKDAKVACACGNKFTIGSTVQTIQVELCSKCHPFYTGKAKLVDTENLVKKYEAKEKAAKKTKVVSKRVKNEKRRGKVTEIKAERELTLKDMLKQIKSK